MVNLFYELVFYFHFSGYQEIYIFLKGIIYVVLKHFISKPDFLKIFRVTSPQVTLLVGIFLIIFSVSLTVTGLKGIFSLIK